MIINNGSVHLDMEYQYHISDGASQSSLALLDQSNLKAEHLISISPASLPFHTSIHNNVIPYFVTSFIISAFMIFSPICLVFEPSSSYLSTAYNQYNVYSPHTYTVQTLFLLLSFIPWSSHLWNSLPAFIFSLTKDPQFFKCKTYRCIPLSCTP